MKLFINWITADSVWKCKKSDEVMEHIRLINPMSYEGGILFDMIIDLPDDWKIEGVQEGLNTFIVITLSKLGTLKLNTIDFRDITISG